jgi:hypothetical protein
MWIEMEAQNNGDDINRVAAVVRSQFRHVIGLIQPNDPIGIAAFEKEMITSPYSVVRERQLKELEVDDMLMSRLPVRFVFSIWKERKGSLNTTICFVETCGSG